MMGGVCHVLIFPRVPGSLVGECGAGTWDGKTNTGLPEVEIKAGYCIWDIETVVHLTAPWGWFKVKSN